MILSLEQASSSIAFSLAPLLEEHGIPLAVMGMLVVFLALVLVVAFITILPRVVAQISAPSPPRPMTDPAAEDVLPEETLVVIAAAVAATVCRPHRIVRIRGLTPEDHGWSLEGRLQHHQSHRIPHRDRR